MALSSDQELELINVELELRKRQDIGKPSSGPSLNEFSGNAVRDAGANIRANAEMGAFAFPPLAAMKAISGTNIYDPQRLAAIGGGMVEGLKDIPGQLKQEFSHPIDSFYKRPISTALDIGSAADLGVNAARAVGGMAAEKFGPGLTKSMAGIPEQATERALAKPAILDTPPVPEDALNQKVGQPIIDAFAKAKQMLGERYGKIFKETAGMEGPMQEIINTPIAQKISPIKSDVPVAQELNPVETLSRGTMGEPAQAKLVPGNMITDSQVTGFKPGAVTAAPRPQTSFNDLLVNKNFAKEAFVNGDEDAMKFLYKKYISPNADLSVISPTNQDKLQILTRLKRDIQAQTDFNKAPVTLAPIDSAKDAALKTMGTQINQMRTNLPGGAKLAAADKGWSAINDIYDTVQRDLSDPGKAKDALMKLLRGDTTWLTSGRMAGKVNAIRSVERITGQKILEPAMEELTRQVFNPWMGKGFVSQFVRGGQAGAAITAAIAGHPVAAAGIGASMLMGSPRIVGAGITAGRTAGDIVSKALPSGMAVALDRLAQARKRNR